MSSSSAEHDKLLVIEHGELKLSFVQKELNAQDDSLSIGDSIY